MKKAIDIVLLPPDNIMDFAIQLNKPWVKGIDDEIVLDKKFCLPHITLAMGLINDEQIIIIQKIMAEIADNFSPLELKITYVYTENLPTRKISGLAIEKSPPLQKLHEMVMDKLVPLFTYDDVTKEMFYSPPLVSDVPLYWVGGFVKNDVRENYRPHITLGMGVPPKIESPIIFTASRLALCHLGNYCTCRDILAEVEIN